MRATPTTAKAAWAIALVALLGYEAWALADGTTGSTLSEAIWSADTQMPYVAFFGGLLCGHLFWRRNDSA